ncbi:MAG: UDP-3-O-acyl-N-acetylglucosamine deacetylase [Myxococcota bacterium]
MQQTTIARAVRWRGIGLHGGKPAVVEVQPAPVDAGLVFVVPGEAGERDVEIPALPASVHSTARATTLASACAAPESAGDRGADDPTRALIATVEHLLAALYALGIDTARIVVGGGEIPVLDGSAAPYALRLRRAGTRRLGAPRRSLAVVREHEIRLDDRRIRVAPCDGLSIDYTIDFDHPCIGRQHFELARLDPATFERELAPARTFGFAREVEALRSLGLGCGGDLGNTLVLDESGLLNPDGLRFPDEFVRHKVVDLLGDLALLGADLQARVTVERGGHGLHHALIRALLEEPGLVAWQTGSRADGVGRARAQRL